MNSPTDLEKLIESQVSEDPPGMARMVIEAVRMFMNDQDAKLLTVAKVENNEKTHYLIDIS